jgi:hypothetical protein
MSLAGFDSAWIVAGATLTVGLLVVAIRWVYRKYRKRQAWAMIKAEREDNKSRFMRSAESFATIAQQLQTNWAAIESLRTRINIPQDSLAGLVVWDCDFPEFNDTAWQTVRRTGLSRLFQPHEAREVEELYTDFCTVQASMARLRREIDAESRHARIVSAETAPQWIADEMELMQAVRIAHDKLRADMRHFTHLHTDFVPSV